MSRGSSVEFKTQSECAIWLWNTYPQTRGCFLLIDNNSSNIVSALQKRAMGMVKGASDTVFIWNRKTYFIEFKSNIGTQSVFQKKFEVIANAHSSGYYIIRSLSEFIKLIESILNGSNS